MLFAMPMSYSYYLLRFEVCNDAFKHKCYSLLSPIYSMAFKTLFQYIDFKHKF